MVESVAQTQVSDTKSDYFRIQGILSFLLFSVTPLLPYSRDFVADRRRYKVYPLKLYDPDDACDDDDN